MCRSTGRWPMAHPPGSDTRASPKRETRGPSTRIDARMVLTNSYGAARLCSFAAVRPTPIFSSSETSTPICAKRFSVVVTSRRWGRFCTRSVSEVSSAAHRIGRAAFLAPEMRTSPVSGTPPWMISLSTKPVEKLSGSPVLGRQGLHRQRVDFLAHAIPESPVDDLVLLHARFTAEFRTHDHRLEMMAIANHFDVIACEAVPDIGPDLFRGNHSTPSSVTQLVAVLEHRQGGE